MATGTNRWKLGLFVVVGAAIALASLIAFGARTFSSSSERYVSYFDESVQGLDVGSAVKFRGVPVGRVEEIGIEVDGDTLDARIPVRVSIRTDAVRFSSPGESVPLDLPALVQRGLRARLAGAPLTNACRPRPVNGNLALFRQHGRQQPGAAYDTSSKSLRGWPWHRNKNDGEHARDA